MNHLYLNNTHAPENFGIKNDQFTKFTLITSAISQVFAQSPAPKKLPQSLHLVI